MYGIMKWSKYWKQLLIPTAESASEWLTQQGNVMAIITKQHKESVSSPSIPWLVMEAKSLVWILSDWCLCKRLISASEVCVDQTPHKNRKTAKLILNHCLVFHQRINQPHLNMQCNQSFSIRSFWLISTYAMKTETIIWCTWEEGLQCGWVFELFLLWFCQT